MNDNARRTFQVVVIGPSYIGEYELIRIIEYHPVDGHAINCGILMVTKHSGELLRALLEKGERDT